MLRKPKKGGKSNNERYYFVFSLTKRMEQMKWESKRKKYDCLILHNFLTWRKRQSPSIFWIIFGNIYKRLVQRISDAEIILCGLSMVGGRGYQTGWSCLQYDKKWHGIDGVQIWRYTKYRKAERTTLSGAGIANSRKITTWATKKINRNGTVEQLKAYAGKGKIAAIEGITIKGSESNDWKLRANCTVKNITISCLDWEWGELGSESVRNGRKKESDDAWVWITQKREGAYFVWAKTPLWTDGENIKTAAAAKNVSSLAKPPTKLVKLVKIVVGAQRGWGVRQGYALEKWIIRSVEEIKKEVIIW